MMSQQSQHNGRGAPTSKDKVQLGPSPLPLWQYSATAEWHNMYYINALTTQYARNVCVLVHSHACQLITRLFLKCNLMNGPNPPFLDYYAVD